MEKLFAVDLFAGCGGLSEGFIQAGFEVIAQIEMNGTACETLKTRHLFHELKKKGFLELYNKYVKNEITREEIFSEIENLQKTIEHRVIQAVLEKNSIEAIIDKIEVSREFHHAQKIHVFLGGPPCQPYSIINRARIQKNGDALGRNYLYEHYLALMHHFKPDVFIYENVPGLFSVRDEGQKIFETLLDDFKHLHPAYEIIPPLHLVSEDPHSYILNSVNFGIPQNRKRLILVGYRKELEQKNEKIKEIFERLRQTKLNSDKYLTIEDAISDLPQVKPGEGNDRFLGPYPERSESGYYQKKMRFLSPGVLNHRARTHMPSDLDRYKFFIKYWMENKKSATLRDLISQWRAFSPDHRNLDEFVDRFKVQWWTKPASTITAHISKDGHYFIHPDIGQCRSFTVREAARCQSFPDNFFFEGPRTEQFRQVGNAVPPLLAKAVGKEVKNELERIYCSILI
jgi:DNA (cytosine-5)-methyltransferase 1